MLLNLCAYRRHTSLPASANSIRPREGRRTRIMVTLDSSNIHQPELLEQLLREGMDIARINCADDSKKEWKMLIDAIRNAEERLIQRGQGIGRR